MKKLLFLFALLVTAVVLLSSCGTQRGGMQQVGEMQRESRSIQAQDAEAVRSILQMGAGELNITGGADRLMEGEFSYNVSNWKPKVSYDVSGERGALTVKQGSGGGVRLGGDARNEWDISLNDEVPTDLVVEMGAGESDLDLDSLTLTGLDLQMGAGKTTVDLTGDYAQDFAGAFRQAFPDWHSTFEELIAEGDRVAERWTGRGTQRGELQGIAPTDRRVEVPGSVFYRIVDGKIVAGAFLIGGHPFPFGTLAFGCFFVAVAWLELAQRATNSVNPNAVNREVTPT